MQVKEDSHIKLTLKRKRIEFEVLRIVAAMMVIFNHTGIYGFEYYTVTKNPILIILSLLLSVVCKINVPFFLMITGALLIEKDEPIEKIYRRRIPRILGAMIISGMANYFFLTVFGGQQLSAADLLKDIYTSSSLINYYLYHYLFILIIMPFLRRLTLNMDNNEVIYFFILYIIFSGFLPVFSCVMNISNIGIPIASFLTKPMFYVVIGYHVSKNCESIQRDHRNVMIYILILSVVVVGFLKYYFYRTTGSATQIFDEMLNPIISCIIFILLSNRFKNIKSCSVNRDICFIASTTFSVFIFADIIKNLILFYFRLPVNFISFLLLTPITFTLSVIWALLLKKIPVLKQVL